MRADWTVSGACINGSTERPKVATRRAASGGAATTNTARADMLIPRRSAALAAADGLGFAAAPTFALMALLTGAGGPSDMLCSAADHASPLSGMALMYWLMSAFHAAPWLKLAARRRSDAGRS